ncbi:MAG TPA: hypothetical protein VL899_13140 [Alphaproteobacteria bacterium]|nr:hypothetical protein [Alphaproteobacteria bacterium]
MTQGDLISLAEVKAYLGGDLQSNDDAVLARLIAAASAFFVSACGRPILLQSFSETYDGKGNGRLYLRQTPVAAVASLSIDGTPVPRATSPGLPGWRLNGNTILLFGHWFGRCLANVAVTYTAGYQTVPADIAEAVAELVGLRYRGRDRLGKTSESIGGMATTSYAQKDVSPFIASVIARYSKVNLA